MSSTKAHINDLDVRVVQGITRFEVQPLREQIRINLLCLLN